MLYLSSFDFTSEDAEYNFIAGIKRTCYDSFYPFKILSERGLGRLSFEPITILYGGNGSGKTTALNVIAEKLELERDTLFNRTNFFDDYKNMCSYQKIKEIPRGSKIITSDDVFDFMLNLRTINEGIHLKRDELFEEYLEAKFSKFQMKSLEDYEELKKVNMARSKSQSQSKHVRKNLMNNVREHSNGESAFLYFTEKIQENSLYLLDEPENSLSPERQQELVRFIEDSARFFGCQFIIATHSPFILSLEEAKIYNLDEDPVDIRKWTELPNVLAYYEFFKKHEGKFDK